MNFTQRKNSKLWRIVKILVIYLLLSSVLPLIPWTTPGGFVNSHVLVLASLSYIFTGHGLIFWDWRLWGGPPPLVWAKLFFRFQGRIMAALTSTAFRRPPQRGSLSCSLKRLKHERSQLRDIVWCFHPAHVSGLLEFIRHYPYFVGCGLADPVVPVSSLTMSLRSIFYWSSQIMKEFWITN